LRTRVEGDGRIGSCLRGDLVRFLESWTQEDLEVGRRFELVEVTDMLIILINKE
jgi:hypothetical protein